MSQTRKRLTDYQQEVLENAYTQTSFPSSKIRDKLAEFLGIHSRTVQIWFQNRRQRMRQKSSVECLTPDTKNTPKNSSQLFSCLSFKHHPSMISITLPSPVKTPCKTNNLDILASIASLEKKKKELDSEMEVL
jgi:hypothetical protein